MKTFEILADATCDLTEELLEQYNITVIPGHLRLPDRTEHLSYPKWNLFSREEFYADLKRRPNEYSTSPANVEEFARAFEEIAEKGEDILALTISGGISGAYGFATQAAAQVMEKYPNVQINVIDSMRFGPGHGLMTVHAARMRDEGKDINEVGKYLEENKNRYHQAGWLDDLSFVARKGRITHPKAFFGTLAGVKPIGEFDYNGLTTVLGKVKGVKAAYAVLLKYMEETIENPEEQTIFIAQTNRLPQAEEYKKMIEEKFHPKEVLIHDVHPLCGVNIGPGLMAAYYVGKPISSDLSTEREIFEKAALGVNA
ncbi:MAG: DegV family protein [Lachnospiraceae bacterium]|nr:DegV family protein [Lachnospiraceae bacterium]